MEDKAVKLTYNPREFFSLGDSMCYDSGICVLSAKVHINGRDYVVKIETQGCVKIIYDGSMYKGASQMPEELCKKFYDGTAYESGKLECIENNWWEIFVFDNAGKLLFSDVLDCEPRDFTDENELITTICEYVNMV